MNNNFIVSSLSTLAIYFFYCALAQAIAAITGNTIYSMMTLAYFKLF